MKKKRLNIERIACMGTVIFIITVIVFILGNFNINLVWQIPLGASIFLPLAYFTFFYFSNTDTKFEDVFFQEYNNLSKFSWKKYRKEFSVYVKVIIFLLLAGLVMYILQSRK